MSLFIVSIRARLISDSEAVAGLGSVEVDGEVDGEGIEFKWLWGCLESNRSALTALFAWCIVERKSSAHFQVNAKGVVMETRSRYAPLSAAPSSFQDGAQFAESFSGAPLNLRFGPDSLLLLRTLRPVT